MTQAAGEDVNSVLADCVVDGRGLEPPEPFERTMAALDTISLGQKVLLILGREPFPLYRALELNGFVWQTKHTVSGEVEVLIQHRM